MPELLQRKMFRIRVKDMFVEEVGAELDDTLDPTDKTGKTTKPGVKNLKKFREI